MQTPIQRQACTPCIYTNVSGTINEHDRIAASRLRLSSHSLAIELVVGHVYLVKDGYAHVARYKLKSMFHQLLAVGRWFPPGTPVSSTRKLISSSSFHRLDMTLAVAEALNPNKPNCPGQFMYVNVTPTWTLQTLAVFFNNTDISSVCRVSSLVLEDFMRQFVSARRLLIICVCDCICIIIILYIEVNKLSIYLFIYLVP